MQPTSRKSSRSQQKFSGDVQKKLALIQELQENIQARPGTQAERAKSLGITQPRLNDLINGRAEKFSLDAVVSLAAKAGLRVDLNLQQVSLPRPRNRRQANQRASRTVFAPAPSELGYLRPDEATGLILNLLRCEATAVGLSPKDVVCSLSTNLPDGGIDAKVEKNCRSGHLLKPGNTHFQIKTGMTFKPWQRSSLRKELLGKANAIPSKELLGKAVRTCMDEQSTYTLITLGHDLTPQQHSESLSTLRELFRDCGYSDPKIELHGQGQLAGELDRFPSLCLDLVGLSDGGFLSLDGWRRNAQMCVPLCLGDAQNDFVSKLRVAVGDNTCQHVRVVGEPGIGKTRLVLEALSTEALAPSVIYVSTGEDFQKSALFRELLKPDRSYAATLVIDDCDDRDRSSIWAALKGIAAIKLVTIDHGPEDTRDSAMRVLHCPALSDEHIEQILASYVGSKAGLRNWAEWCSGSPRVAHAIGENLKSNPSDVLKSPADVPIWDRFIIGHKQLDSLAAEQHRIVLRHVALFQKFGYEVPVSKEAEFICDFIATRAGSAISWARFQEIIQYYRSRRILQGRHTLFIVPKALHVYLWVDFWNKHGRGFSFTDFFQNVPPGMRKWFLQLFPYAHASGPAQNVVKQILSRNGPFSDLAFLRSETGLRFLNYLAEADPNGTLGVLERTIGTWSHQELHSWQTGRQDIVWTLEKLAVWEELFPRAVRILISMALAENAKHSNNATGTLLGLYNVGLGWAPTKARPEVRYPIIKELLTSDDVGKRMLALEMCKQWLETHGGVRIVGPEHQGLRPTIEFWRPQTYGEVFDAWRMVLSLMEGELGGFDVQTRNKICAILTDVASGLIRIDAVSNDVFKLLFTLASDSEISKKPLTNVVVRELRQRYEKLSNKARGKLTELDTLLTGTSLWERTVRYAINTSWDEDYAFRGEKYKELKLPVQRVQKLAKEYMEGQGQFIEHLPKLLKESGHRLAQLGEECGKLAASLEYDELVVNQTKLNASSVNSLFLSGYVAGIRTHDQGRAENMCRTLLKDGDTRGLAVDCIWCAGVAETLLREMLQLFKEKLLPPNAFARMAYVRKEDGIPDQLLEDIATALLSHHDDGAVNICVQLLHTRYCENMSDGPFPEGLIFDALTAKPGGKGRFDTMEGFHWQKVAEAFIKRCPTRSLDLLRAALGSMEKISRYGDAAFITNVLDQIAEAYPEESWEVVSALLSSGDRMFYELTHWLGELGFEDTGKGGAIRYFPPEQVLAWVGADKENRMWLIGEVLPKTLESDEGGALTVRFIEMFCDDDQVAGSLITHFHMGGWSGPESQYLAKKRDAARKWLSEATSAKLQSWLGRYIDYLSNRIESCQIEEERTF